MTTNIKRLVINERPIWIGIQGGTGAGKSFFASALSAQLGIQDTAIISLDDFFYPCDRRAIANDITAHNFDHPSAVDWELLRESSFTLDKNNPVLIPSFDQDSGLRNEPMLVSPRKYIIIEGLLPFYFQPLFDLLHVSVFIDTPPDVRLSRLVFRNVVEGMREWTVESLLAYYTQCARPMHLEFVEAGKRLADIVINGDDAIEVGLAAVTDYLTSLQKVI